MTVTFKGIALVEAEKLIPLTLTSKLEKENYDIFAPEINRQTGHYGEVNMP